MATNVLRSLHLMGLILFLLKPAARPFQKAAVFPLGTGDVL